MTDEISLNGLEYSLVQDKKVFNKPIEKPRLNVINNTPIKMIKAQIIELINNPNISDTERIYAKFVTGAYYYFGLGNIEKDYNKAFQIIKECADKGHIAAIYDLGANFYFNGNGTDINYDLADYYLNLAKENGLKRAIDLYDARSKTK